MIEFGKIFKKIRESRQLSLKEVAKSGISTSQLSRFENGITDLTITKFVTALDSLNMSIEEFMYAAHEFHNDDLTDLLEKIKFFVSSKDDFNLRNLLINYQESEVIRSKYRQLNILLIKIHLQKLSDEKYYTTEDINLLTDYLFGVEFWGYYELLLFSNTLDVLNHETMIILAREMNRRSDFYKEISKHRRLIADMNLAAYIKCVENNLLFDALYFEKQLNLCMFNEMEVYDRIMIVYTRSLYKYKKTNNPKYIIEMRKCVAALKLANSFKVADNLEKKLENILSQVKG